MAAMSMVLEVGVSVGVESCKIVFLEGTFYSLVHKLLL